jgi:hypothetical protein
LRPLPPRDFRCLIASKSEHGAVHEEAGLIYLDSAIHLFRTMCIQPPL